MLMKRTQPSLFRSRVGAFSPFAWMGLIIAFGSSAATGFGQAAAAKPLAEAHLEHIQDPPISISPRRLETSPKRVVPFGPYTSYQVNVDSNGNNILGDAANEPSITV